MGKIKAVYSDSLLKQKLREQSSEILGYVYSNYRREFIGFAIKYSIDKDKALDIYQDSVIALYQNFATKSVDLKENVSVKTYLFGIGKNKIYSELKRSKKNFNIIDFDHEVSSTITKNDELTIQQLKLKKGLAQMGVKCKRILNLFYYRGLTIKEIVEHTLYKDENTVKSLKSRCLKKLKELI